MSATDTEYPKALYKGGQEGEMRIVPDSDGEAEARADGFVDLSEPTGTGGLPGGTTRTARGGARS